MKLTADLSKLQAVGDVQVKDGGSDGGQIRFLLDHFITSFQINMDGPWNPARVYAVNLGISKLSELGYQAFCTAAQAQETISCISKHETIFDSHRPIFVPSFVHIAREHRSILT